MRLAKNLSRGLEVAQPEAVKLSVGLLTNPRQRFGKPGQVRIESPVWIPNKIRETACTLRTFCPARAGSPTRTRSKAGGIFFIRE